MSSQGPLNWGTSADDTTDGGTVAWSGTGSPGTPGYGTTSGQTHYLKLTNFGFSIAALSSILGIQVSLTTTKSGSSAMDNSVKLLKGGALTGSDKSAGASWGATNNYGGTSDVWGATLSASDVNASGFGVALQGNVSPATTGALTGATITVTYAPVLDESILVPVLRSMDCAAAIRPRPVLLPYRCQSRSLVWSPRRRLWLPDPLMPLAV